MIPGHTSSVVNRVPLSSSQMRLWISDRVNSGSSEYNVTGLLEIRGALNVRDLERALEAIVRRHEVLRMRVAETGGEPYQIFEPHVEVPLETTDLESLSLSAQQTQIEASAHAERVRLFDLTRGPMFRFRLMRRHANEHVLIATFHHIAFDQWSRSVFFRELAALYESYSTETPNSLEPLQASYADFVVSQRDRLEGGRLSEGLNYWSAQLANMPERMALPASRTVGVAQRWSADTVQVVLPLREMEVLKAFNRRHHVTSFMTLLATFIALLARYTNEEDIVVACPVAGRGETKLEPLIGCFVNRVLIRSAVRQHESFASLLESVRHTTLEAFRHQEVPFERVVERLASTQKLKTSALFQVAFAMQNVPPALPRLTDLVVSSADPLLHAHNDLELHVQQGTDGLQFSWLYNPNVFDRLQVQHLAEHFGRLLSAGILHPDESIGSFSLLGVEEKRRVLEDWNQTVEMAPSGCLGALFEAQVERTPDALALISDDALWTYSELEARVNVWARRLRARGIGPGAIVAVALDRSPDLVVALLAVIKAGAAYLPLDPSGPVERHKYCLRDARPAIILTKAVGNVGECPESEYCLFDCSPGDVSNLGVSTSRCDVPELRPDHPAYVIYTSGSTGRPKGVVIPHSAIVNKVSTLVDYLRLSAASRFAATTSVGFDPLFDQILCPLVCGGATVLVSDEIQVYPDRFRAYLKQHGVTVLNGTPASLQLLLLEKPCESAIRLNTLIVGGDVVTSSLSHALQQAGVAERLLNFYGPTETCINATAYDFTTHAPALPVPIGKPLPNYQTYVLDDALQPVPVGVSGELYIAGAGLALGYLNDQSLTGERFVPNPFGSCTDRMYRTGDRVRWQSDGNLEFLGRCDAQIKIGGVRIEPREIEAALMQHCDVAEAIVVPQSDTAGDVRLVGYLLKRPGVSIDPSNIRLRLARVLPSAMIPAALVGIETWPLTVHGKIDRAALPPVLGSGEEWRPPQSLEEETLCGVIGELIGSSRVSPTDDFFVLGGHSLMAMRLVSRIASTLLVELPLRAVFEAPRISDLALRIRAARGRERPALTALPRPFQVPLSFQQQRLWFVSQRESAALQYSCAAPFTVLGNVNVAALEWAIGTIVERHEVLRTRISESGGEPCQITDPAELLRLTVDDLRHLPHDQQTAVVRQIVQESHDTVFDLARGPVLRVRLLRLGDEEWVLLLALHHIVSDDWSLGVLFRELEVLYNAYCDGQPSPLPPLPVQYADFALWQRKVFGDECVAAGLDYWGRQLADLPDAVTLPLDRPRPPIPQFAGDVVHVTLAAAQLDALKEVARQHDATLYMTLLAAFGVLLTRLTDERDVAVGSPVAHRPDPVLDDLIGFFVNVVVMRLHVDREEPFTGLLRRVRHATLEAYQHQEVPFEQVVERLARSGNTGPAFRVMFLMQNAPSHPRRLRGLSIEPAADRPLRAHCDLELHARERDGGLTLSWRYDRGLFDRLQIANVAAAFCRLLEGITHDPSRTSDELPLVSADERAHLTSHWNTTFASWRSQTGYWSAPLPSALENWRRTADAMPGAPALLQDEQCVSYESLRQRVESIGAAIQRHGGGAGSFVTILTESPLSLAASVLGTLEAGCAVVPLDPDLPDARLLAMITAARPTLTLSDGACRLRLERLGVGSVVDIDDGVPAESFAPARWTSDQPCCLYFTSGTTGVPKGVIGRMAGLDHQVDWVTRAFELGAGIRVGQLAGVGFSAYLRDLLVALTTGGTLCIPPRHATGDPVRLVAWARESGIEQMHCVPTILRTLLSGLEDGQGLPSLRNVLVSGEVLRPADVRRWYAVLGDRPRLVNMLGTTETMLAKIAHIVEPDDMHRAAVPTGRPIPGATAMVVDSEGQPCPPGAVGEIWVWTPYRSLGYLQEETTGLSDRPKTAHSDEERFLFRTGDLGRCTADGVFEYVGRRDTQVKIRGTRVELGEVEAAIAAQEGVDDVTVVKREDGDGPNLVAYVTGRPNEEALRVALRAVLPTAMVPSHFMRLERMPRTPTGKIDRRALPVPSLISRRSRAPETALEQLLCDVIAEVLGVEQVGPDDDFFELGGHSLLAMRITARIRSRLDVEFPIRDLFEATSIAESARRIAERVSTPAPVG